MNEYMAIFDAMIIAEKIAKKRHGNEIQLVQILLKSRLDWRNKNGNKR